MANGDKKKPYRPGSDHTKDLRKKMLEDNQLTLDESAVEEKFLESSSKQPGEAASTQLKLDPITSLPEVEIDNRTPREKKAAQKIYDSSKAGDFIRTKKFQKLGDIQGTDMVEAFDINALELTEDVDFTPYIEGGLALEAGDIKKGEAGSFYEGIDKKWIMQQDVAHLAKMRQLGLDKDFKAYQQQLYDSRTWYEEWYKNFTKIEGLIGINVVGGILGTVYGAGRALFTWDIDNFFKGNHIFQATDWATNELNKHTLLIGKPGWDVAGYDENGEPIRKSIGDRFVSDPAKSINEDIAPAIGFVGGAVVSELLLSMMTFGSGGAAAPALAANTARIGAQGSRLARAYGKVRNAFKAKVHAVRGLGATDEINRMANQIDRVRRFRQGLGTARAMVTSTGYESALIAESTRERVLEQLITEYKKANNDAEPPPHMLEKFNEDADKAGRSALLINTVIVGGSNMLQFPKLFVKGYTGSRNAAKALKLTDGKWVSKYAQKKWYTKGAIWGYKGLKNGVVEAWEEGSQGALEEGLVDYFGNNYSKEKAFWTVDSVNALVKGAKHFLRSVEGKDSMKIGAVMGMMGLPLPINTRSGKAKFGIIPQWYGGAIGDWVELYQKNKNTVELAKKLNGDLSGQSFISNMNNIGAQVQTTEGETAAAARRDPFSYKNEEHTSLFNWVTSRMELGLEETIMQDLDAIQKMSIEEFNKEYGTEGGTPTTKEAKDFVIAKAKKRVQSIIDVTKKVNTIYDAKAQIDNPTLKKQLVYTASQIENLNEREKELEARVRELTNGAINAPAYFGKGGEKVESEITGVKEVSEEDLKKQTDLEDKLQFADNVGTLTREEFNKWKEGKSEEEIQKATELRRVAELNNWTLGKGAIENWEAEDPASYAQNKAEVIDLLADLVKIKRRRARAGNFYNSLFTEKGAKAFEKVEKLVMDKYGEAIGEAIEKVNKENADSAQTVEDAKSNIEDEITTTGSAKAAINKNKESKELLLKALNKKGKVKSLTSDEIDKALDLIFGTKDSNGMPYLALEILNSIGFNEINIKDADEIRELIENGTINPKEKAALYGAIVQSLNEGIVSEAAEVNKTTPEDPEQYDESPFVDNTANRKSTKTAEGTGSAFEERDLKGIKDTENETLLLHHDRVQPDGKIKYNKEGEHVENNTKKSIKEKTNENGVIYNESIINSPKSTIQPGTEVEVMIPDTAYNRGEVKGYETINASNMEMWVVKREGTDLIYLGTLPEGTSNQLSKLRKEAWRELLEETPVKVKVKERTNGRINTVKGAENNPKEVLDNFNESGEKKTDFPLVFMINIKGQNKGLSKSFSEANPEYQEAADNSNMQPGYVYMMVPAANGQIVPIQLFTNKLKDSGEVVSKKVEGLLSKMSKARKKETKDGYRKELEGMFSNRVISHTENGFKITEFKTDKKGTRRGTVLGNNMNLKEAMDVLNNSILRVSWKKINTRNENSYLTDNGILTTNSQLDKNNDLFHSSSVILEGYNGTEVDNKAESVDESLVPSKEDTDTVNKNETSEGKSEPPGGKPNEQPNIGEEYNADDEFDILDLDADQVSDDLEVEEETPPSGLKDLEYPEGYVETISDVTKPKLEKTETPEEEIDRLLKEGEPFGQKWKDLETERDNEKNKKKKSQIQAQMDKLWNDELADRQKRIAELKEGLKKRPPGTKGDSKYKLRATKKVDGRKWDKKKEIEWLKSKLGKHIIDNTKMFGSLEDLQKYLPEGVYEMLIEAQKQGKDLHGVFSNAALYLNENSLEGTAYHEAFHVVFTLSLTEDQRQALLKEASEKYKNELPENATPREIEELLADKFMEYVQSEEATSDTLTGKIKNFFKKLFRMIKTFYNNEVNINDVFKDIQLGVYKNTAKFENTNLSELASYKLREKIRDELSKIERFNNPLVAEDALETLRFTFNKIVDLLGNKNPKLKGKSPIEIVQKLGIGYINNYMLNTLKAAENKQKGTKLGARYSDLLRVLTNNGANITTVTNSKGKTQLKFTDSSLLLKMFNASLANQGIHIKQNIASNITSDLGGSSLEEFIDEGMSNEEAWMRGHMMINQRDTMSQRLKQFLSDIPVYTSNSVRATSTKNHFGTPIMEHPGEIYSFLISNISGSYEVDTMMDKLKKVQKKKPFVKHIIAKLEENPSLKSDMLIHIGSKSFNKFITIQKVGQKYVAFYSNRKNLDNIVKEDLVANFNSQTNILLKRKGKKRKSGEDIDVQQVLKFREMLTIVRKNLTTNGLSQADLKRLSKELNKRGFRLSKQDLEAIEDFGKEGDKKSMMSQFLSKIIKITEQMAVVDKKSGTVKEGVNPFLHLKGSEQLEKKDKIIENDMVLSLGEFLKPIHETNVVASFRNVENKTVYNLQLSNYLSRKMTEWSQKDNIEDFMTKIADDPLLSNSPLLLDLLEDEKYREEIEYTVLDGLTEVGRETKLKYSKMSPLELEATAMAAWKWSNDSYGFYKIPIPSDSTTTAMVKLKKLTEEEIIDKLTKVAEGEILTMQRLANMPEDSEILKVKSGNTTFAEKANKFTILPFLNGKIDTKAGYNSEVEALVKKEIKKYLNGEFLQKELEKYKKFGIVDTYNLEEGLLKTAPGILDTSLLEKQLGFLKDYLFNNYYANTQLTTLFSGNPSFYNGIADYQKRNKQVISPKTHIDTTNTYKDPQGKTTSAGKTYTGLYVKDEQEKSSTEVIDAVISIIDQSDLRESEKTRLKAIHSNTEHNLTDGQTIITPQRYKKIMIGLNRWNNVKEAAYKRVLSGTETVDDIALFPPIKPFMFTHLIIDGFSVPTQHKNSEIMLTRSMAHMKSKKGEDMFPKLKKLYQIMQRNKIDSVLFDSSVKVGITNSMEFSKLEEATPEMIEKMSHSFNNEDWGLQQETPAHHVDETNNFGTQIRQLILEGIDPAGTYTIPNIDPKKPGRKLTGEQVIMEFQELIETDLQESYENVLKEFEKPDGSINYRKLLKELRQEVLDRGLGMEFLEALEEIVVEGQIRPVLELYHPIHSARIEAMLNSFFKNRVTKQKTPGGQFINTSSFGVSQHLKFHVDKKTGNIHMDVMLPAWSKRFFENGKEVDLEKLREAGLLDLLGYRIPNEHKYSDFVLNVVGFTPAVSGGQIILPKEVTTYAGLDFDIDKFFVMVPAFTKEDGEFKRVEYIDEKEAKKNPDKLYENYIERVKRTKKAKQVLKAIDARDMKILDEEGEIIDMHYTFKKKMKENRKLADQFLKALGVDTMDEAITELENMGEILSKEEFLELSIPMQNGKAARDNQKLDIMRAILTNKDTAIDILNVGSFDLYTNLSTRIRLMEKGSPKRALELKDSELKEERERLDKEEGLNMNLPSTQLEFFSRNMTGVDLIGIMAIQNTHHAKAQLTDMHILEMYGLKFNGETYTELNLSKKDGIRMSQTLASLLAAVVDNAKEPISYHLNLNTYTGNTVAMMARLGIDEETLFYFMANPILKEVSKKYFSRRGSLGMTMASDKSIEEAIAPSVKILKNRHKEIYGQDESFLTFNSHLADIAEEGLSKKELIEAFDLERQLKILKEDLANEQALENPDLEHVAFMEQGVKEFEEKVARINYKIASTFKSAHATAEQLSESIKASRSDTKGVGPSQADNYVFLESQERVRNIAAGDLRIAGLAETFDGTARQIMMPAFNQFGIVGPTSFMDKLFPYNGRQDPNNPNRIIFNLLGEIKNYFSSQKGRVPLKAEEARLIQVDYMAYYMSKFPFFDYQNSQDILEETPLKWQKFRERIGEVESEKGTRTVYTNIVNSLVSLQADKKFPITRIEFVKTGRTAQDEAKLRAAWTYMLNDDTELEEGYTYSDLAKDLIKYSFYSTGYDFGPYSFQNIIPTAFFTDEFQIENGLAYKDELGTTVTMSTHLRRMDNHIRSTEGADALDSPDMKNFINQFTRNNSDRYNLVRTVRPHVPSKFYGVDKKGKDWPVPGVSGKPRVNPKTGETYFEERTAKAIFLIQDRPSKDYDGNPQNFNWSSNNTGEFVDFIVAETRKGTRFLYAKVPGSEQPIDPKDENSRLRAVYRPIGPLGTSQFSKEYNGNGPIEKSSTQKVIDSARKKEIKARKNKRKRLTEELNNKGAVVPGKTIRKEDNDGTPEHLKGLGSGKTLRSLVDNVKKGMKKGPGKVDKKAEETKKQMPDPKNVVKIDGKGYAIKKDGTVIDSNYKEVTNKQLINKVHSNWKVRNNRAAIVTLTINNKKHKYAVDPIKEIIIAISDKPAVDGTKLPWKKGNKFRKEAIDKARKIIESKKETTQPQAGVEVVDRYTVADVKANPNKIYIFGDNITEKGKKGQAIIRDEKNAFGIPTKVSPSNESRAFMSDDKYESNIGLINSAIEKIKADGRPVVFPKDGLGTGLAKLKEKAPKTYAYLKQRLLEEFGFDNDTGEIVTTQPATETKIPYTTKTENGKSISELGITKQVWDSLSPKDQNKILKCN